MHEWVLIALMVTSVRNNDVSVVANIPGCASEQLCEEAVKVFVAMSTLGNSHTYLPKCIQTK